MASLFQKGARQATKRRQLLENGMHVADAPILDSMYASVAVFCHQPVSFPQKEQFDREIWFGPFREVPWRVRDDRGLECGQSMLTWHTEISKKNCSTPHLKKSLLAHWCHFAPLHESTAEGYATTVDDAGGLSNRGQY